jgi:hypothetical protein
LLGLELVLNDDDVLFDDVEVLLKEEVALVVELLEVLLVDDDVICLVQRMYNQKIEVANV